MDTATRAYSHDKDDLLVRLRRSEGQVRGLPRQVEQDTYAPDGGGGDDKVTEATAAIARLLCA